MCLMRSPLVFFSALGAVMVRQHQQTYQDTTFSNEQLAHSGKILGSTVVSMKAHGESVQLTNAVTGAPVSALARQLTAGVVSELRTSRACLRWDERIVKRLS